MKFILSIVLITCIISISSCYYDNEELLYGTANSGPCTDTTGTVSYAQTVLPILQQQCYSCHTGSSPSGNQLMGTYTADKVMGQSGKLYGSVIQAPGFSPMPQGLPRLNNCRVATIKKWIDAGMPNN